MQAECQEAYQRHCAICRLTGVETYVDNVHRMLSELKWFDAYLKKN